MINVRTMITYETKAFAKALGHHCCHARHEIWRRQKIEDKQRWFWLVMTIFDDIEDGKSLWTVTRKNISKHKDACLFANIERYYVLNGKPSLTHPKHEIPKITLGSFKVQGVFSYLRATVRRRTSKFMKIKNKTKKFQRPVFALVCLFYKSLWEFTREPTRNISFQNWIRKAWIRQSFVFLPNHWMKKIIDKLGEQFHRASPQPTICNSKFE